MTYSVTANPTITARNATMTIAGQSFDVTQAGQPCTYTLTPAGASVPATATTGTVAVAALGGCAWTATSSAAWVTITSGATGSGNGTVGYSVAANGTTSSRTATLTIGGQSFTITQAAAPCVYTASPATPSFPASGGPGTVTMTTLAGCAWSATTSAAWITIGGTGAGSGNGTFDYTVAANPIPTARSGTIAVAGQSLRCRRRPRRALHAVAGERLGGVGCGDGDVLDGGDGGLQLDRDEQRAVADGHERRERQWQRHGWLRGGSESEYDGADGDDQRRRADVHGDAGGGGVQHDDLADGELADGGRRRRDGGGDGERGSCAWTAASNAPWITITAGASGTGNGSVSYNVAANALTSSRTGTMTIAGQTMTVTQAGAPCTYTISPTVASLGPAASTNTIAVTAPAGCAWTTSESATWISITGGARALGTGR